MKIRIEKCADALAKVNGDARAHTYTPHALMAVAERAEAQLESLGIPKFQRPGAMVHCISGGSVPNAYKYSRALTRAALTRTSGGWWLIAVSCINGREGFEALYLTGLQDATAVTHLRKGYRRV
jgi:hypothetical protein